MERGNEFGIFSNSDYKCTYNKQRRISEAAGRLRIPICPVHGPTLAARWFS
jgi:hypothetical protein